MEMGVQKDEKDHKEVARVVRKMRTMRIKRNRPILEEGNSPSKMKSVDV